MRVRAARGSPSTSSTQEGSEPGDGGSLCAGDPRAETYTPGMQQTGNAHALTVSLVTATPAPR